MAILRGMDTTSGQINDKVSGNFQNHDFLAEGPQDPERHDTAIMFAATGQPSRTTVMIRKMPMEARRRGPDEQPDDETQKPHEYHYLVLWGV